jgi:hypothetical protein
MFFERLENSQNITLPNSVRTLPNTVRFLEPRNRSTRLSYQNFNHIHNLDNNFWNKFEEYLKNIYRKNSVKARFLYAKQYHQVLLEENAQSIVILPNDKRLQVMKSLSVLSKFIGCYDKWKDIKERYQLKWSSENSVDTFKKIINEDNSFNNLLEWLKNTTSQISERHRNILFYCTLTGLRPDEACQSIRLVKQNIDNYLDKEKMILKHFELSFLIFLLEEPTKPM